MNSSHRIGSIVFVLIFTAAVSLHAQSVPSGSIEGRITDLETSMPLPGANIRLGTGARGTTSDARGRFTLNDVPAGSYTIQASLLGYQSVTKTDIIVGASRATQVTIGLKETSLEAAEVLVTAGFFNTRGQEPVSSISFSSEEVRRAPGVGGDISRIILGLPSLAKVNDQSNSLIVRGGSPMENAFFVDGIEIPNVNHFPTQGATGGPIGIINADLLDDVSFSAGGFSAAYGDKLSSVMNMRLRDGSRSSRQSQLDLNFAGFGGMTEGPITGDGKATYLVSVRRSYLDLLVHAIDIGTSVAPSYGDVTAKLTAEIAPGHTLSLLDIFSDDHNNPDRTTAVENDMIYYGNQDIYLNTAGLTWRALWNASMFSTLSVSYSTSEYAEENFETNSGAHLVRNRSFEGTATVAAMAHYKFNSVHSLELGASAKHLRSVYDNFYDAYTNALGDTIPAFPFNCTVQGWKVGGYVNYNVAPVPEWTITAGARIDHYPYNATTTLAPRLASSWQVTDRFLLKASAGLYYQTLPMILLSQIGNPRELRNPEAAHLIAGCDYLLTADTKLSLEAYRKTYRSFPIDPEQKPLFLVDELFYRYGFYFAHGTMTDDGRAESNGIEVIVQKKLAEDVYGLASASYFTTRYRGGDGVWRDRAFDNRYVVSLEGGYKPDERWEFSGRWIVAGGVPYTPFNADASAALNRAVLDASRVNGARLPAYHCLNLRADRRWHFASTNLVAYLSMWNAYNQRNISGYFWNGEKRRQEPVVQWGLLPIFGVKYEF